MPTPSDTRMITLVAMAPSGETFLARDGRGVLSLYGPSRPPRAVDEDAVGRAILAGFDPVGESFASWPELDRELQRRAGLLAPTLTEDIASWDDGRVDRALAALDDWIAKGRTAAARRVLHQLITVPAVGRRMDVLTEISELLGRCDRAVVRLPDHPPDELHATARVRMHL